MSFDDPQSANPAVTKAKLSSAQRVQQDVSSVALSMTAASVGSSESTPHPAVSSQALHLLTDAEVMLRVAAGDDAAFDYLVEKFRRPLVGFMYRMAHNQAVAEELAQEVFLRVYRARSSYSAEAKFTTWLYRIATNLAVNHARDTKPEKATTSIDETDEETGLAIDVADSHPNAEQEILRRERLAAIRRQVEALPERQRLAVIMHKYQNMDYKQIADVLKLSESATKSLLFRAYETLREKLKNFV
ncbi:MAG: sigma-70 family RNA polymerase sigma factor [Acidobacteria bacterium]|nr:sigma-70 family RNA polymerase sigma factor [Acidobacteriota bacterium]